MKRTIQSIIFVLTFFTAGANCDMGYGGGMGRGGHGMHAGSGAQNRQPQQQRPIINTDNLREILTFEKELGLSDKQVENIRQIRSDSIKEISQRYEDVQKTQADLSDMLGQVKPDFDAVRGKLKQMNEAVISAQMVSVNAYEQAFNLLSDEQKAKLVAIREKIRKEKMDENTPQESTQGR